MEDQQIVVVEQVPCKALTRVARAEFSLCSVHPCGWVRGGFPYRGGGEFRPGTISQGIISPGENFATLEIPEAPSKHVSRKMSLNFRKMI